MTPKRPPLLLFLLAALLILAGAAAVFVFGTAPMRAEKRWKQATQSELETALGQNPGNPKAAFYLGQRLQEAGETQAALEAYWKAIQAAPEDEAAWKAWAPLAAQVLGAQQAYGVLEAFLKEHPGSGRGHLMLAALLFQNGYNKGAYDEAAQAVKLNPALGEAYPIMGNAAAADEQHTEAEAAFRKALQRDPDDPRSHVGLGEALSGQRRNGEARAAFEQAVRLAPDQGGGHFKLGKLLLGIAASPAEAAGAQKHLLRAADLAGTMPPEAVFSTYLGLGQACARQSDWKGARDWLEKAQTLNPNEASVPYELASVYRRLGNTTGAAQARKRHQAIIAFQSDVQKLTDRIAAASEDWNARLRLARLQAANGALVEAIRTYRVLLSRVPEMAVARQEYEAVARRYEDSLAR